jgi:hypothetical protein
MYNIINYFYKTSPTKTPEAPKIPDPPTQKIEEQESRSTVTRNKKTNTVYLVIEKNTQNPLGIFDNFEKAKQSGQKTSHHNCVIIPFQINDPCKYLFNPVFENK